MNRPITVVLADDHALVCGALARWFQDCPDIHVVAQVADADAAVAAARRHRAAVVIFDIDMPGRDCFDAARALRATQPETRVVFLSALVHDCYIEQALAVRAAGYLTKGCPPETVAAAIRGACAGCLQFAPEVRTRLVIDPNGARLARPEHTLSARLTARELEVLRHVARGLTNKAVAQLLKIDTDTVHSHVARLLRKLDGRSRVDLARFALREGLLPV